MNRLGVRLEAALDLLKKTKLLADIGTDHAYFPIEAIQSGKAVLAIASDNKSLPLATAMDNVTQAGLSDRIELILAEGLAFMVPEIDCVSIMGMGGILIAQILASGDLSHVKQLILGPNNNQTAVRGWLQEHGWQIQDERFVRDKGHDYQLIAAVPGVMKLDFDQLAYGPINLCQKNPVFIHSIQRKITILSKAQCAAKDLTKIESLLQRIAALRRLIA
jgi:tRNA (adenine22-N1)-methyltransferase